MTQAFPSPFLIQTTKSETHLNCINTMQRSFLKTLVLAMITACALTFSTTALAQMVTSGITGVARGSDGKALSGITVTAVHTPTNATFTAVTSPTGRFNFRGLPVGGPYTVSASSSGYADATTTDVITALGSDTEVPLVLKSEVLQLEKFVATGSRNTLDASATGAGNTLTSERLAEKPSSERSLADMISASPFVTLRSTFGDREESQITALGQNNRFNSIMIDGARINDVFGLNGTGLASFFNPLSLDTIEQLSVQVSPYDVRQSGFTGASINAVTKSGTNQFHGSAYYYYRNDHLGGTALQGPNARERTLTGAKVIPALDRRTWGGTFGGPIIRNKLFFFLNYEDFKSVSAGRDQRFSTPQEAAILARFQKYATDAGRTIDWGNPVTGATSNTATDTKYIGKVDWQINSNHRLSVRMSKTDGLVPQFGNFASGTSSNAGITGGGVTTSSDGHFYEQTRVEKSESAQLFSQWTPDFKTELKYSSTKQDQLTPIHTVAPMTYVFGVSGTDLLNNTAVTNGAYIVGTEQFRQGNVINVDSQQMSASGDYFWKNFVFTFGAEREQSNFNNLFRQGSFGLAGFRTYNDFLNDTGFLVTRNYYDPAIRPVSDISEFATTGIFAQAKWDVNPRLVANFGVRYEFAEAGLKPALNTAFQAATGFRNDGSLDGVTTVSPRAGFNLALDEERVTQIRGGLGHFLGRSPWVFFSNSFGNTGVGTFTRSSTDATNPLPSSFTAYLKNEFDPANPIGTGTDNPTLRREVDFNDNKVKLPSAWRANLAIDRKLPFLDSTLSAEFVYTKIDQALFTTNENLKKASVGLDGRQIFAGNPATQAFALYSGYTNLYRVSNVSTGESSYFNLSWDRPMKNKWAFNLAYTRGRATEAQANGQTTAGGQFNRNVIFNQNTVETGTADFEIKDRVQFSLTRRFQFLQKFSTDVSLYYEGRSGNPYSWVFGSDLNKDGVSFNDTVFVPTGPSDSRFDFSGMTAAQQNAFFAYLDSSGLSKYAGKAVPKNSFVEPWFNKLDLKLVQDIPLHGPVKLQLFFDFINFGNFISKKTFNYVEISPFLSNDVFRTRTLTSATSYTTDGRIKPLFQGTTAGSIFAPSGFNIDNGMSRWRIQLGAKLLF